MTILETVQQRKQQADKVKASGILDDMHFDAPTDDGLTEVTGYSANVAWSYEGENKEAAEKKYKALRANTGYAIDYSKMQ